MSAKQHSLPGSTYAAFSNRRLHFICTRLPTIWVRLRPIDISRLFVTQLQRINLTTMKSVDSSSQYKDWSSMPYCREVKRRFNVITSTLKRVQNCTGLNTFSSGLGIMDLISTSNLKAAPDVKPDWRFRQ